MGIHGRCRHLSISALVLHMKQFPVADPSTLHRLARNLVPESALYSVTARVQARDRGKWLPSGMCTRRPVVEIRWWQQT